MNNDSKLIFETYTLNGLAKGKTVEDIAKKHGVQTKDIQAQIEKGVQIEHEHTGDEQTARKIAMDHVFENPKYYDNLSKIEAKSEDSEKRLTYTYEVATANLPRDIDVSTKEGQDKVLSLAYNELVKAYTGKYKNPSLAARNTFDKDFKMEVISQYKHYQEHGFPGEDGNESPEQYAKDSEKDYVSQKIGSEDAETAEEKKLRVSRGWELNKQRWAKWKAQNPEAAAKHAAAKKSLPPAYKPKDARLGKSSDEDAEMPVHDFNKLKQHIHKGPIQIKQPAKELPYTHHYMHPLVKQDPREGEIEKEENAEDVNTRNWVNTFHRTFGPGYKEELQRSKLDPYKTYVDYYGAYLKNPDVVDKFANIYNAKYPSHPVDLNKLHQAIELTKNKPEAGYRAPVK